MCNCNLREKTIHHLDVCVASMVDVEGDVLTRKKDMILGRLTMARCLDLIDSEEFDDYLCQVLSFEGVNSIVF